MVVRGINEQKRPKEERYDTTLGDNEFEETLKIYTEPTEEGKRWVQECVKDPTGAVKRLYSPSPNLTRCQQIVVLLMQIEQYQKKIRQLERKINEQQQELMR